MVRAGVRKLWPVKESSPARDVVQILLLITRPFIDFYFLMHSIVCVL
jgi:hypothetical protein